MNKSEFHRAIIVALGVVEGQSAKLVDCNSDVWQSSVESKNNLSIMTITKNGKKAYKEVYDHNIGDAKEFFY